MRRFPLFCILLFILLPTGVFCQSGEHTPATWKNDIASFEKADKASKPPQKAILFTGSSSIRFWEDLPQRFPNKKVINRGFGGAYLSDVVYYFDRIVIPYRPRKIVVYAGENDIAGGKTADEVFQHFEALLRLWKQKASRSKFIFISLKPSPVRYEKISEVRKANELIRQRLKEEKRATFVDVFTPMLGPDGKPREELFRPDRLHLNKQGYDLWESLVRPYL